jgi:hypothetical protein
MQTAEMIQSAIRGHATRQQNIARLQSNSLGRRASSTTRATTASDDSEADDTAEFLQSSMRAHNYRRQMMLG